MLTSDGVKEAIDSYDVTDVTSVSMSGRDHRKSARPSPGVVRVVNSRTNLSGSANGSGRSSVA
jgi:hypothetical protein